MENNVFDFNEKIMKADSFRDRLKGLISWQGLTGQEIADSIGCTKATISSLTTGRTSTVSGALLLGLSEVFQVDPEWLLTGKGSPVRKTYTPSQIENGLQESLKKAVNVTLAEYGLTAVKSCAIGDKENTAVSINFLADIKQKASDLQAYTVQGSEMQPLICNEDVILVNVNDTRIISGKIYALALNEETVICRRIYKQITSHEITLHCENAIFNQDEVINLSNLSFKIIGRVVAVLNRKID